LDYSVKDLESYCKKIEEVGKKFELSFYPQEFEAIDYNDMMAYQVYIGMPSMYPHWSFGKAYERIKALYNLNLTGLPYEMVINSDPTIAYLLKDNTLLLQILTMAHVYGHNDFFKNNRLFSVGTKPIYTIEMFKRHGDIIREYVDSPGIGYEKVEKILDAAHSIKLQRERTVGVKTLEPEIGKPCEDILSFVNKFGELETWQKNIISIVREETAYFIPQIETKIINEGWASLWHYKILKKLDLPDPLYIEFIKRHNQVVAKGNKGSINPYNLGFNMFLDIEKRYGTEKIFEARLLERDESFIRKYITLELAQELGIFQYKEKNSDILVEAVADEDNFEKIKATLLSTCGMNSVPIIKVVDVLKKDKTMYLEHSYDGRELNANYAEQTLKNIVNLWGHSAELKTIINEKELIINCDENGRVKYC